MSRRAGRPKVDAVPARSKHSLIVTGRPASGPGFSPRASAASRSAAPLRALSVRSTATALIWPFTAASRAAKCSTTSLAESSRRATSAAISRADMSRKISARAARAAVAPHTGVMVAASARRAFGSDHRDRFHFDQELRLCERGDSHQRVRRHLLAEELLADRAVIGAVADVGEIGVDLDDVLHRAAARLDLRLERLQGRARLRLEVT